MDNTNINLTMAPSNTNLASSFGNPQLGSTPQTSPYRLRENNQLPSEPAEASSPPRLPDVPNRATSPQSSIDQSIQRSVSEGRSKSASPPRPRTHRSARKRSKIATGTRAGNAEQSRDAKACSLIVQFIRKKRMSVPSFFAEYVKMEFTDEASVATRRRNDLTQVLFRDDIRDLLNRDADKGWISSRRDVSSLDQDVFLSEFNALVGCNAFRTWQIEHAEGGRPGFEELDIEADMKEIETLAPNWVALARKLTLPIRSHWASYRGRKEVNMTRDDSVQRLVWYVTSIFMYKRAPSAAGFPLVELGLWLESSGVKDRVITGLSRLGGCPGLTAIKARLDRLESHAKGRLAALGNDPRATIVYDNYDFLDTVTDQALGSTNEMRHLTTAYAFINRGIPEAGLKQDMLRRNVPLKLRDVAADATISRDVLGPKWPQQLFFRGMEHAVRSEFRDWRKTHSVPWPVPKTTCLSPEPVEIVHLGGMAINSGTTEGTAAVHEAIMNQELGVRIQENDQIFSQRLYIILGDQKSVGLSRAVRADQQDASDSFDRRNWMLPVPCKFHVQMNLTMALLQVFWAPVDKKGSGRYTQHSFLADVSILGIKGISQERAPWYDADMLIRTSFDARILATFLQIAEGLGVANRKEHGTPDGVRKLIPEIQPAQMTRIESIMQRLLFSNSTQQDGVYIDEQGAKVDLPAHMVTLVRFMQAMFIYVILRHAIRYGDVGTIRILIPTLAVIFYGTGKTKYGKEMLYLYWLLSDTVSDPEVQQAILHSLVINTSGRKDSFMPPDRRLEHINSTVRHDQKAQKNSTHDWRITFGKYLRIVPILADISKTVETALGIRISGKHSTKDTSADVLTIGLQLWLDDRANWTVSHPSQATAPNLFDIGFKQLPKAVANFNTNAVDGPDSPPPGWTEEGELVERNRDGGESTGNETEPLGTGDAIIDRLTADQSLLEPYTWSNSVSSSRLEN